MLREHARYIEFMLQRVRGLEAAVSERDSQILYLKQQMSERDRQIVELNKAIDGFLTSYCWRLTLPLRKTKLIVDFARQRMNWVWLFGRADRSK